MSSSAQPSTPPRPQVTERVVARPVAAPGAGRAHSPRLLVGFDPDALRRRLLVIADVFAVVIATLAGTFGQLSLAAAFWVIVPLPVWLLLAKLHGLYDRDRRSMRH